MLDRPGIVTKGALREILMVPLDFRLVEQWLNF